MYKPPPTHTHPAPGKEREGQRMRLRGGAEAWKKMQPRMDPPALLQQADPALPPAYTSLSEEGAKGDPAQKVLKAVGGGGAGGDQGKPR